MHPREYLSYSQLMCIESGDEAYIKEYLYGKKRGINRGTALGKEVADSLESGEETGDMMKDLVIAQLPKFEIMDEKMLMNLRSGSEMIPILIKCDSIRPDLLAFKEYKTGDEKSKWTQAKVDTDDQVTFYAAGIFAKVGKIPEAELIWAPSRKVMGEDGIERPELTGEIRRFPTRRSLTQIIKMHARMARAWRRIGELTDNELL